MTRAPSRGALVVLCTETDDYTAPRGTELSTNQVVVLDALLGSCEGPPGVAVGCVYALLPGEIHPLLLPVGGLPGPWQARVQAFRAQERPAYGRFSLPWELEEAFAR